MSEESLQELKDRGKSALRDKDLDLAIECFSEVGGLAMIGYACR